MPLAGVILAGGRSSRMDGRDKAFLTLDGRTLAERAYERLAPQVEAVALSFNGDPRSLPLPGVATIADADDSRAGPLAGILAGLHWAGTLERPFSGLVSVAVDTPFFPGDLAQRLAAATGGDPGLIAVATSQGARHPTFALWPLAIAGRLAAYIAEGGRRAGRFIEGERHVTVEFQPEDGLDPFFNVNTPADFDAAGASLRSTS